MEITDHMILQQAITSIKNNFETLEILWMPHISHRRVVTYAMWLFVLRNKVQLTLRFFFIV